MPNIKQILTWLAILVVGSSLWAQTDDFNITNFGFEDGLSHRNVFKVQQDTNGFLWVATAQGLNRYDGHQFLTWKANDDQHHIPQDNLRDIYLDEKNRLWCSAADGSMFVFDLSKNEVDSVVFKQPAPGQQHLSSICQDANGRTWAVSYQSDGKTSWLCRTDKSGKLSPVSQLPGQYEGRPIARSGGLVYVGAIENELWVFDLNGQQVQQFEFTAPASDPSFSRVIELQAGRDGSLWVLLDHGQVYHLPPNGAAFRRHPVSEQLPNDLRSTAFSVGNNEDILVVGIINSMSGPEGSPCSSVQPGASLFHYDATSGLTEDHSYYLKQVLPYAEPPRQIFQDRTGTIWIASAFGLIRVVDHDLFTRYMADGNDCCRDGVCSMRGITEDDRGYIYFSYYSSLHVLNPTSGSLTPLFAKQLGAPFGIQYHDGAIYTGEGIRINLQRLSVDTVIRNISGREGVVTLSPTGKLWFGNGNRLVRFDSGSGETVTIGDGSNGAQKIDFQAITHLFFSKKNKGTLWVATGSNGIFEIKNNGEVLRHLTTKTSPALPNDRILALSEVNGTLWFGSAAGLGRYNPESDGLKTYTTEDGLPNNFINGLLAEGDSALWVSTDNGLSRMDLRTGQFSTFYASDGLSKNEFNRSSFFQASDGRMYFGGINGVNAFYPSSRYGNQQDQQNSRLVLTGFERFDGDQDYQQTWGLNRGEGFELSYRDQMFTLHFSLTDYGDPNSHLYSYQLEGYDQDWAPASPVNFARYFNIPPGKYVFRARASRGGSNWIPNELAIPVVIHQAFYKSGWFQMLALALLTVLVYAIMRYRLHLLQEHEQELESLVQVRTQELETEKKKSDDLLLNILPAETAEELKLYGKTKARRYENVTVMFSDFKEFSIISADMEPENLVAEIDHCFRAFDEITELYGLEKIKTVGDAYLLAGGISAKDNEEAAVRVVQAALEIQTFLTALAIERKEQGLPNFEARIGIHSGPIVAGIVGFKKFAYDIWGHTVNIAERLQSSGEVSKVNVSKSTFELIKHRFECTYRGKIEVKHQGEVDMYFINRFRE